MSLTPQWLDELRSRTLLSALVGRTLKITKAGREFKGCCPFHNEKTPSFYVNDDKGFYHCLAGETKVLTQTGRVEIAALSGTTVPILTRRSQWLPATFKSYGTQRLWKISLSRNRVKKQIYATDGHRWFVKGRKDAVLTTDLQIGRTLQSAFPKQCGDWTLDPEGVRHGIIFGDGSMYKQIYGTINLHGEKDVQLRTWFPNQKHHVHEREGGKLYLRVYGGRAFERMKTLPSITAPASYLLGFLAGYIAADGHVAKDGTVMLNSANAQTLESVRDIATTLGIATYGRTTLLRKGYGSSNSALHRIHFVTSTLNEDLFLLNEAKRRYATNRKAFDRLHWTIRAVEMSDRFETVYCAEVPGEHAFALDDNILTGNCFGCSAHGDAIRWMTDQRGLGFMDAVKELAEAAGMEVPAPDPRAAEKAERGNALYDVMAAAQNWFVEQLQGIEGAEARAYLKKRGLSDATIKAFGLGFAPDARGKLKAALSTFGNDKLIESGLLISVEEKEPYDRFRGRLMIPIRDPRGREIAFGGRILGAGEPKYLNSPDTPLFDKGRTLYNLDRAGPESRKSGRMIVVEGYMDVIALAQAGIGDVVAPLGTALTEHQIERLWRMSETPILCFDGDSAGQKASVRAIGRALPALAPSRSLNFVTLPAGQDPDDLIKSGGRAAMDALLAEPEALVDRLWRHELAAESLTTPEAKAGLKRRLTEQAQAIQNGDVRGNYLAEFRQRLDGLYVQQSPQRGRFTPGRSRYEAAPSGRTKSISGTGIEPMFARAILAGLLRHPTMLLACSEAVAQLHFGDPELDQMRHILIDAAFDHPSLDSAALITICNEQGLAKLVSDLQSANNLFSFTRPQASSEVARRDLGMAIEALASRPELDAALAAATARLQEDWNEAGFAEQTRLLEARRAADQRLAALAEGDNDAV